MFLCTSSLITIMEILQICCMADLKVMVPIAVLKVSKFKITYENYSLTQLQNKFWNFLINSLLTFCSKYCIVPKTVKKNPFQ